MDHIITKRATESECNNADGQPPPLLDSPLPTPRRSCTSVEALRRMRCRRDASPLRTRVPFSWESSPGVPKSSACKKAQPLMPPPRPPPGRLLQPYLARNLYYGNTSEASSDDDDDDDNDDDRSFSDALDKISSPEPTGSFDRVTSKRFEDIFVGRATSFAKDRTRTRHPGAEATDLSASGRRPRQPRRGSTRRSHDEDRDDRRWTPRLLNDNVPMQLMQRIRMDADAEEMTPRACGLMVFFPWSAKPAVCGFRSPAAQHATTTTRDRAEVPSPSHSRRLTTTLRDVIDEDSQAVRSDMPPPPPRGEKKRGRDHDDSPSRRWGVSSLLDTSKKYCTDARKALSKLSIGRGADGGSPRVSGENRSGKLHGGFSSTPATPVTLTQLMKDNRN